MIPPLRERGDDVVALAEHFVAHYAEETEKRITGISDAAMRQGAPVNLLRNVARCQRVCPKGGSLRF